MSWTTGTTFSGFVYRLVEDEGIEGDAFKALCVLYGREKLREAYRMGRDASLAKECPDRKKAAANDSE